MQNQFNLFQPCCISHRAAPASLAARWCRCKQGRLSAMLARAELCRDVWTARFPSIAMPTERQRGRQAFECDGFRRADENCAEHTWQLGRTSAEYRQYARGLRRTVGPGDSWFGRGVANVQAVASATERLTSSVSEIGRQLSQSTGITGRAVASGTDQIAARMFDAANEISRRSDVLRTSVEVPAAIGTA